MKNQRTGQDLRAYTEGVLARIGPANRPFAQHFVQRRRNDGLRPKSVHNVAVALAHADRLLGGRPLAAATEQDWMDLVSAFRETMAETTVFRHVYLLRRALRDLLEVDKLPKPLDRALYVKPPREKFVGRILSDVEFHRMLATAGDQGQLMGTLPRVELSQAILWTLWDTGFRASELLSLNVGDVKFDGYRGAKISLRPEAENLKTGPRTIYVCECVGALRTWLEFHPAGHDPTAPLFPGFRDRSGQQRMDYQRLLNHVVVIGNRSGINAASSRARRLHPHDFRHTCATRKAKAGWMEAELRAYFGWAPGSHMPSLYVHLALGDMRERVRRDAGVDDNGYQQAMDAGDDARALAALIAKMAAPPKPDAQTHKPAPWQLS